MMLAGVSVVTINEKMYIASQLIQQVDRYRC